jgi:hypothetical protein
MWRVPRVAALPLVYCSWAPGASRFNPGLAGRYGVLCAPVGYVWAMTASWQVCSSRVVASLLFLTLIPSFVFTVQAAG